MGRYGSMLKCAEIRRLVDKGEYERALQIIEKIDTTHIKVITDLNAIAEVYMKTDHYQEAREIYLRVYEKSGTRRVISQLVCVAIKNGDLEEAEDFFKEYTEIDEESSDRLILRYRLEKAKKVSQAELILLLEQLKHQDYMEEWAYELAKLYHKEGREEDCVRECSDIILWFGEGIIVEKAKLLKEHYVEGLDLSAESLLKRREQLQEEESKNKVAEDEKDSVKEEVEMEKPVEEEFLQEDKELEEILEEACEGYIPPHFVVIGNDEDIMIEEAKLLAKKLFTRKMIASGKVAKISAEKLNSVNLQSTKEKLRNGCLFINGAGDLTVESVKALTEVMEEYQSEIIIILGDTKDAMEWLFRKCKKLKDYFKYDIYV